MGRQLGMSGQACLEGLGLGGGIGFTNAKTKVKRGWLPSKRVCACKGEESLPGKVLCRHWGLEGWEFLTGHSGMPNLTWHKAC